MKVTELAQTDYMLVGKNEEQLLVQAIKNNKVNPVQFQKGMWLFNATKAGDSKLAFQTMVPFFLECMKKMKETTSSGVKTMTVELRIESSSEVKKALKAQGGTEDTKAGLDIKYDVKRNTAASIRSETPFHPNFKKSSHYLNDKHLEFVQCASPLNILHQALIQQGLNVLDHPENDFSPLLGSNSVELLLTFSSTGVIDVCIDAPQSVMIGASFSRNEEMKFHFKAEWTTYSRNEIPQLKDAVNIMKTVFEPCVIPLVETLLKIAKLYEPKKELLLAQRAKDDEAMKKFEELKVKSEEEYEARKADHDAEVRDLVKTATEHKKQVSDGGWLSSFFGNAPPSKFEVKLPPLPPSLIPPVVSELVAKLPIRTCVHGPRLAGKTSFIWSVKQIMQGEFVDAPLEVRDPPPHDDEGTKQEHSTEIKRLMVGPICAQFIDQAGGEPIRNAEDKSDIMNVSILVISPEDLLKKGDSKDDILLEYEKAKGNYNIALVLIGKIDQFFSEPKPKGAETWTRSDELWKNPTKAGEFKRWCEKLQHEVTNKVPVYPIETPVKGVIPSEESMKRMWERNANAFHGILQVILMRLQSLK